MTTQADITLALSHITNTSAPALQTDINTLINAIADQNNISGPVKLNRLILPAIKTASDQIAVLINTINSTAGASAV